MNFDQFSLDPRIAAGIKAVGYTTPTPIQQQAIPVVLEGRDILGLAQTGTGKTAVFVLPILQRLLKGTTRRVRALVLAPTRELAEQIHEMTEGLGRKTGLHSVAVYGGVSKVKQVSALKSGAEIVIACPGRLLDLVGDRSLDLSHVEVLVLDEADRMCDMGFLPDIRRVLKLVPAQRQTLFFSATMPADIRELADTILKDPVTVQVGDLTPVETVSHALYPVPESLKKELLFATLQQTPTGRVLIFTRTKHRAHSLARDLAKRSYRASELQGNMSQNQRQAAIDGFRDGRYDILVATDVASRGIDVMEITHVINYDMPDTVDAYTHRIGRTGRAELTGEAFSFPCRDDEALVRDIEKVLGTRIERRRLPGFDYGSFIPESQPEPRPDRNARLPRFVQGKPAAAPRRESRSYADRLRPERPRAERNRNGSDAPDRGPRDYANRQRPERPRAERNRNGSDAPDRGPRDYADRQRPERPKADRSRGTFAAPDRGPRDYADRQRSERSRPDREPRSYADPRPRDVVRQDRPRQNRPRTDRPRAARPGNGNGDPRRGQGPSRRPASQATQGRGGRKESGKNFPR